MGFLDVFQPGSGAPAPGLPPDLLNFIRSQQLAGMATGLLRASGPSRLPVGFGAAMGEGLASAQQAGTRAQEAGYRGLLFQTRREDAERKRQTLGAQRQAVADLGPLARAFPGKYASAKFGAEFREPKESTEPKEAFQRAKDLRAQFVKLSGEFIKVRDAGRRVEVSAANPSAAGDLALIFNYMKILDPGSTVREGEFATAESSGSVPARLVAKYNKVLRGERLSPLQRFDFVSKAKALVKTQARTHGKLISEYERLSKLFNVSPEGVVVDFTSSLEQGPLPQPAPQTVPAGLPAGSVLIGPMQGKPVFQTPDGKRFVEE